MCPQTLGSERNPYAIARPDKIGTGAVAAGGMDGGRRGKRGEEEEPVSKHQIQPGCRE